jgi:predicted O-methyltransferase YrrM
MASLKPKRTGRLGAAADRLSRDERAATARAIARSAYLGGRRLAERVGVQVVVATYDSPVPRIADLTDEIFAAESPLRGIDWDPSRQMDWIEHELGPSLREFSPARGRDSAPGEFTLDNDTFESVDAELLYAFVRRFKPERVVELGSGFSTLVARMALDRNAADGHPGTLDTYDPYPSGQVMARLDLRERVQRIAAQDTDPALIAGLAPDDILFVDTTHTVKIGGDVNRVVLDLLPLVPPGVVVHFHDIFLPRDYSRGHIEGAHFWTEQYLVQAFLSGNREWEVLVGANSVAHAHRDRLQALIPSITPRVEPGSLWLRRLAP